MWAFGHGRCVSGQTVRVNNMLFYGEEEKNVPNSNLSLLYSVKKEVRDMVESGFQAKLIKELKARFPGCMVLKNDPNYIQGIPDLLVLYNDKWASLECKKGSRAKRQPNQDYYISQMDSMSFARFIQPENKEAVLDELQQAFESGRSARVPRSE